MPRLTNRDYLRTHRQLRRYWLKAPGLFGSLKPRQQWYLHDFFQPSKDWSEAQLLEHREAISEQRPSLPQQAGRALAPLQEHAAQYARPRAQTPVAPGRRERGAIKVRGVVKPEIDMKQLARALLAVANELREAEQQNTEDQAL